MSTITIRLPDAKHSRLKTLARSQNVSLNKLFEEWATVALAQQDAQASFAMRVGIGSAAWSCWINWMHILHPTESRRI